MAMTEFMQSDPQGDSTRAAHLRSLLILMQAAAGLTCALLHVIIPRKPDVYRHGNAVDRLHAASLLGRATFSWPNSILRLAVLQRSLEITDIPSLDHHVRSESLADAFDQARPYYRLWQRLIFANRSIIVLQLALATISASVAFIPQIILYIILQAVEARNSRNEVPSNIWLFVCALGLSLVVSSLMDSWLYFISCARLGLPVFQQLAGAIFKKALRRRIFAGDMVDGSNLSRKQAAPDDEEPGSTQAFQFEADGAGGHEMQSTENLVGVDADRVSMFASCLYKLPDTCVKVTLSLSFLLHLIGGVPLLIGFVVPVAVLIINTLASNGYTKAQVDLVRLRDVKTNMVTATLRGIRQIKLSAFEDAWERRIMRSRKEELNAQWRGFKFESILLTTW